MAIVAYIFVFFLMFFNEPIPYYEHFKRRKEYYKLKKQNS